MDYLQELYRSNIGSFFHYTSYQSIIFREKNRFFTVILEKANDDDDDDDS